MSNPPRPLVFSVFEHVTPDQIPAVGVYRGGGLSIAVSGQNGADVFNAMGRVTGVHPMFCRKWLSHDKLAEWLAIAGFVDQQKFYDKAARIEPGGRYLQMALSGQISPMQAKQMAYADPLDGLYFGVGGPISRAHQSGNRDVSYVILGDWKT